MSRRESLEHWIAEQEAEGTDGSWQWEAMVSELRALWAVVDASTLYKDICDHWSTSPKTAQDAEAHFDKSIVAYWEGQ